MTKRNFRTGTLGFLFSLAMVQAAVALPANIPVAGTTNQPIGHYEFCKRAAGECRAIAKDAGPLVLTQDNWKMILRVNYDINAAIEPMTDMELYGVEEHWVYPTTAGDCEDYVLLKRKLLMDAGISASNLLITVVLQPNGEGHAVLTVRTDRGDFILDNMRNKVMLWSETEYRYLKRQSSRHAGKWVKLQDGRADLVGSVR